MTRLLFWIALVILVVMAVRSKLRAALNANNDAAAGHVPDGHVPDAAGPRAGFPSGAQGRVGDAVERMASCAACGLHFPASEAVVADGREYCSPAHVPARARPAP